MATREKTPMSRNDPPQRGAAEWDRLLAEDWEWRLADCPPFATLIGDARYDDRWTDYSAEAWDRRARRHREFLRKLERVDTKSLDDRRRLDHALLLHEIRLHVEGLRFPDELMPLSQMGGTHQEAAEVMQFTPRQTAEARERIVLRLQAVGAMIDQTIALLRRGIETGITPPQAILKPVPTQIAAQVARDPEAAPIARVLLAEPPADAAPADWSRFGRQVRRALEKTVFPAYERLHAYVTREYLPRARATIGIASLPEGKAWYAHLIRRNTSTDLGAQEIHDLGLREVARLRAAMLRTLKSAGHRGDLPSYFQHLRTDPRYFFSDREALLSGYRDLCKRIDANLPRLFRTLPRLPYGVVPVPAYSEREQTTAYYQPGSPQAGRAGLFYANTYDLQARPKWEMEALAAHEAVPGHHLQIALAQEMEDLPLFRRHGHHTAYIEGWGLYAESLGEELGLYRDPPSAFGRLTYEMWRAIRLVVDTGLHAFGWSRAKAIRYFESNAGKAGHDIAVEVDRYCAWPGQALAYKLGELTLQELRARARRAHGARFDVRAFHDAVLLAGPLPLSILRDRVEAWIASVPGARGGNGEGKTKERSARGARTRPARAARAAR
jgi:uncharacterized protein (DUF885 family)